MCEKLPAAKTTDRGRLHVLRFAALVWPMLAPGLARLRQDSQGIYSCPRRSFSPRHYLISVPAFCAYATCSWHTTCFFVSRPVPCVSLSCARRRGRGGWRARLWVGACVRVVRVRACARSGVLECARACMCACDFVRAHVRVCAHVCACVAWVCLCVLACVRVRAHVRV